MFRIALQYHLEVAQRRLGPVLKTMHAGAVNVGIYIVEIEARRGVKIVEGMVVSTKLTLNISALALGFVALWSQPDNGVVVALRPFQIVRHPIR